MTQYTGALSINSERYADEVICWVTQSNVDNVDNNWVIDLPTGFGDALLLEALFEAYGITTASSFAATVPPPGLFGVIVAPGSGTWQDFLGAGPLWTHSVAAATDKRVTGELHPEMPTLWRQYEQLLLRIPALDADAGDTSDWVFSARLKRLRVPGT